MLEIFASTHNAWFIIIKNDLLIRIYIINWGLEASHYDIMIFGKLGIKHYSYLSVSKINQNQTN